MKKKVVGLCMAIVMGCTLLSGCGDQNAKPAGKSDPKAKTAEKKDSGKTKIGVSIWSTSDSLGGSCKTMLDAAAKALDCELVYVEANADQEQEIASIENLAASGCDGIIICNSSDGEMSSIINTCQTYDVKIAQFFRTLNDEEVKKMADESDVYVGRTFEDETTTGQKMAEIMAEKGCKNVGIISQDHGNTTYEKRCSGYKEKFEELGVTIVAEQWDCNNSEKASNAVNNFVASYPEMDGIVVIGGGGEPLEGTMSAVDNNGLTGKITVCSTDFTANLGEQLENGGISAMSGGHWTDPLFSLLMVYNAVNGAYDGEKSAIEVVHPMMYVASVGDYKDYEKYFCGDVLPFTEEEIQNLAVTYNKDTTVQDLKDTAAALSIQDVKERHKDLVK